MLSVGRGLFLLIYLHGAWRYLGLKISDEWFRLFYSYDTHREVDKGRAPQARTVGVVVCPQVVLRAYQRV